MSDINISMLLIYNAVKVDMSYIHVNAVGSKILYNVNDTANKNVQVQHQFGRI
jgi:hypothetical protein